jgi:hypothetical protein
MSDRCLKGLDMRFSTDLGTKVFDGTAPPGHSHVGAEIGIRE